MSTVLGHSEYQSRLQHASSIPPPPNHYFIIWLMLPWCCQIAYTLPQRWKTNSSNLFLLMRYWSQLLCWPSHIFLERWMSSVKHHYFSFSLFIIFSLIQKGRSSYGTCTLNVKWLLPFLWFFCYNLISLKWSFMIILVCVYSVFFISFFFFLLQIISILLSYLETYENGQANGWPWPGAQHIKMKECQGNEQDQCPEQFVRAEVLEYMSVIDLINFWNKLLQRMQKEKSVHTLLLAQQAPLCCHVWSV